MRLSIAWDHAVIATCRRRRQQGLPISPRLEAWALDAEAAVRSRRKRDRITDRATVPPPIPRYRARSVAEQRARTRAWVMSRPMEGAC